MSTLRWFNDMIDNFYCFDIPKWTLYLHPNSEGEWLACSYREGEKKFSSLFKDYEEAKNQAIEFATTYKE